MIVYRPEDGERASIAVVRALADVAGVDAVDLPPLNRAVDPDALDRLLSGRDGGCVIFDHLCYRVTVTTEEIRLLPLDEYQSPEQHEWVDGF